MLAGSFAAVKFSALANFEQGRCIQEAAPLIARVLMHLRVDDHIWRAIPLI